LPACLPGAFPPATLAFSFFPLAAPFLAGQKSLGFRSSAALRPLMRCRRPRHPREEPEWGVGEGDFGACIFDAGPHVEDILDMTKRYGGEMIKFLRLRRDSISESRFS